MERTAAEAINAPAVTPAAAERVAALGRTIALLEQHDWQIILETKDAGDAGLALKAIEASRPAMAGGTAAGAGSGANAKTAAATATSTATGSAASAKTKRHVRLEVSAGTLLDKDTVARLIALDVIASTPKPIASTRLGASLPAAGVGADAASAETPASTDANAMPTPAPLRHADGNGDAIPVSAEDSALFDAMTRPYTHLIASSAPFVLYSAWPVAPIDPRFALSLIVRDGVRLAGDHKPNADSLTARLARAIDACTRYAALASGDQEQQGVIAKEMLADLVIFSADLFALPPDKFMDAEVTTTIFDGRVIYTRPEPAADTSSQ